jgi:hypothetical protein
MHTCISHTHLHTPYLHDPCTHTYTPTYILLSYIAPALHQQAPPPLAAAPSKCVMLMTLGWDSSNSRRGHRSSTVCQVEKRGEECGACQHERRRMRVRSVYVVLHYICMTVIPSSTHSSHHPAYVPAYLLPTCSCLGTYIPSPLHRYLPINLAPCIGTYIPSIHTRYRYHS